MYISEVPYGMVKCIAEIPDPSALILPHFMKIIGIF